MKKYTLQVNADDNQIKNRERLTRLFHQTPLPDDHLMVNIGLYQRSTLIAKILYLNELYEKVIHIPGVIMEFGSWYGQTLIQLFNLRAIYEPYNYTRKIIGFDTFTGYSGITQKDGTGDLIKKGQYSVPHNYFSYLTALLEYHEKENSMAHIKKYELVKGDASKSIHTYLSNHKETIIALALFDMQLYKPTKACLSAILPHLVKGSIIAMDELNSSEFPGETIAMVQSLGLTKYPIYRSKYLPDRSYIVVS